MSRVENSTTPMNIEVKRFYPPFSVFSNCPGCGEEQEHDHYLSYPRVNDVCSVDFYHECGDEDQEWSVDIIISVTARLADGGES